MATTRDDSSQQRYLHFGDTLLLLLRDRHGYVYSELSGSQHNLVTVFPKQRKLTEEIPERRESLSETLDDGDPFFPNVMFAVFKVMMPNKCKAQQRFLHLQLLRENGGCSAVSDSELIAAKKAAELEEKQNAKDQEKNSHRVVLYGDKIQLLHMGSKRYVSLSSEHTSRTENNSLLVQLTEYYSDLCVFNILPRYKIRLLGDRVCFFDQIKLESQNTQGQYLHCSSRTLKSVGVSVNSDHYELNLSATESAMTTIPHFSPSTPHHPKAVRSGTCVRMFHRENECYLVAEGSFAGEEPVVENVHCRQRRVEQKLHWKPSTSANTYWQIEKETDPRSGEVLFWKECCRIKHLPTRMYLGLEMEDDDDWSVVLKDKEMDDPDPETLFLFTPLIEEGDEIIDGSYARIQHLVSGRYLHVREEKPYRPRHTDSIKGLPELQTTLLFTVTAARERGDYDAFTLQQVEEQHLDNFNYAAGIVPILATHIKNISDGGHKLMEKEANKVCGALAELTTWLGESYNDKETKNRQKLLRNLKILEQLIEILKTSDQQKLLLTHSSLHVPICQECYNVIQEYLKGDSRKNENYVARFIEFFQTQVGKGLNAENVLVEIVQDNFGIISMMASTQLDSTMAQLYETKNPTFLHFLSSLCICSGRPIRATQDQVLGTLFQSQVGDLLLKTEVRVEAGTTMVFCSRSDIAEINVNDLVEGQYVFNMLEAQNLLFARLCEGNNEKAIKKLKYAPKDEEGPARGFVSLKEALTCSSDQNLHPLLRSRYVTLILNMFVKVGNNWSFLDHLCYSFIYDDLVKNPYQFSAGEQTTALTGEVNEDFPVLQKWILTTLETNKVMRCEKEHIVHNEVIAKILDVLCHLVNYGYYDSMADVEEVLTPLVTMLEGQASLREFKATGTLQDTRENRALFNVTEKAILVVDKLHTFHLYVTLQRFLFDFKRMEEDDLDDNLAFLKQLRYFSDTHPLSDDDGNPAADNLLDQLVLTLSMRERLQEISSTLNFPQARMKTILINVSRYKSDSLACLALRILTQMHFFENTLFSHAAEVQLLASKDSVAQCRKLSTLLPKLRHLLGIDCSVQGQWKILEILDTLTGMCCLPDDDEPHSQNQQLLCNYGVVSDILNYILAKGSQHQVSIHKRKVSSVHDPRVGSEQETMLKRCLHLLQALSCRNEVVQRRLFSSLDELVHVDLPLLPLADLLTEVFTGAPELSLNVKEEDVERIFELLVESTDMFAQSQLMETLQAMCKIEDVDLVVKRNQALIVKNYCQYCDTFHTDLLGKDKEKQEKRWNILTQSAQTNAELQLLLSFTDLMATCAEGENSFIDSVCQNLFSEEELILIISKEDLSITRKKPFVRFLHWVYMHTDAGSTSRNMLAHGETMWAFLSSVAELLVSILNMLQGSSHLSPFKASRIRASKRKRTISVATKPPVANPITKQFTLSKHGEDGHLRVAALEYLTEAIIPLLGAFYKLFFDSVGCSAEQLDKELHISAAICNAMFKLGSQLLKFSSNRMQLQRFHECMITIYGIHDVRSMLDVNPEFIVKFMRQVQVQRPHVSSSVRNYKHTFSRQMSLNKSLHVFVKMCEMSFIGPNSAEHQIRSPVADLFYSDDGEELPLGPNFQELVCYFLSFNNQHTYQGCTVKPEAELLLKQLEISMSIEDPLSEAEQQQQDLLDIRCLQVLRALIHNQIKMIDPELKDRDPVVYRRLCKQYVHPVQISIQQFGNAVERVAPLISHRNDAVAREALSFLKTLLFSGNRNVQKGFELFSRSREDKIILTFKSRLEFAINRYEESCSLKDEMRARHEYDKIHVQSPSLLRKSNTSTTLPLPQKSVNLQTMSLPRNFPQGSYEEFKETQLHTAISIEEEVATEEDKKPLPIHMSSTIPRITITRKNILQHLGQEDLLQQEEENADEGLNQILSPDTSFTLVLEVMGLMCDGQFKSMQDYLRDQPSSYKSTDMVAAAAAILQTYTANMSSENYEIVHKILQTLIELCVGNSTNQLVILDHQVVESINHLLQMQSQDSECSHPLTVTQCSLCPLCKKFTETLTVKGSAVELLESMLEETSTQTGVVIKGVLDSLDRSALLKTMEYFNEMQSHPLVKTVQMDDDARRGMFRAYHTHVILTENTEDEDQTQEQLVTVDQKKLMEGLRSHTRSVEIAYEKNDEKILTKVYFPHTTDLREAVVEKIKWSINRDTIEDKQRALLDLFAPLKRDLKHQTFLKKNIILRFLTAFSRPRHVLLILLTMFLCLLVLVSQGKPPDRDLMNITGLGVPTPRFVEYPSVIYVFGSFHLLLSLWMVIEYFLTNLPHFRPPLILYQIIDSVSKNAQYSVYYIKQLCTSQARPPPKLDSVITIPDRSSLDVSLPCLSAIWVLLFLACSILSFINEGNGYFYCICALHIVFNNDILQRVLRAVTKNIVALLWVALLGIIVLLIYSVISYVFYHEYFYKTDDSLLFCQSLLECFVSILRYGLLDGIGLVVPFETEEQKDAPSSTTSNSIIQVASWRLILDLSFFIIVTTIGLNIVFGIIVDTFSELREERNNIEEDQKSKCFICDLQAQEFDRKAEGFLNHVKFDHNMWDYVYYSLYLDSIDVSDHNAIQKYVYDMIEDCKIEFFPHESALSLEPEEDPTEMKLGQIQRRLESMEQIFRAKEENRSIKVKRNERQKREEKALRFLQRRGGRGGGLPRGPVGVEGLEQSLATSSLLQFYKEQ